ncbi:MAG: aldehyde dehydrogenase family protein [Lachnospiraceae bacterium]|nr:aldehyde dehydrogenase family protein [Lachnospiraceae bacterium]
MKEYKLYLAGEWVDTKSGKVVDDLNPADGSVFAKVHTAGKDELETAIVKGLEAQKAWIALLPEEREKVLLKAADIMEAHLPEYGQILIEESGSCFMKAMDEVAQTVNIFRAAAGECRRVDGGVTPGEVAGEFSYWVREPLGLCAGIGPFNYPLLLCANKVVFALAAGNSFILKPASDTPVSGGVIIAECLEAAGLPKGVFSVLPGPGSVIGDGLVEDERVKMIAFTGSTKVGSAIAVKAATHLKKYALEMGGKNPIIILKDADIEQAVETTLFGAYFHQGQICMATSRVIVEAPIYDEFCDKLLARVKNLKVGDPHDQMTIIGPLIHEEQCAFIDGQIKDATSKSATLLCGGTHKGAFYDPSLLKDVTPEMEIFHEESFGPITSIIKAKDAEDALALCNNNKYGLSAAVMTNDVRIAMDFAKRVESGMVHINDTTVAGSRRAPFGGVKKSGIGREDSAFSIEEFTELKWVTIRYEKRGFPPM